MLALKIICWTYLIFLLLGRIANYDKKDSQSNEVRFIDNCVIVVLMLVVYFLLNK